MNNEYVNSFFVWLCPNCGEKQLALNKENVGKNTCPSCGASQVFRHLGRKHDRVDIYRPAG